MDRTDRLRIADSLIAQARRRIGVIEHPDDNEPKQAIKYGQMMFEQGRVAGLIEAANLVLADCENPGCPEHGELGVTP